MRKITKNDRIGYITKTLSENPKRVYTLNYFADYFNCAKSTLSEDIDYVRHIFSDFSLGEIETISGAAGGVQYIPSLTEEQKKEFCQHLCQVINNKERIITGGFIYTNDILFDPSITSMIGKMLADPYQKVDVDYVVTIEAKGIPIALMTAKMLNKPMIVIRKSARLTEGTTIQMNYITGSSRRIQTMAVPKKAIPKGSKVLFVDDFMKAGGTAKGVTDLMKECEAEVVGIGVVMTTAEPREKLINNYQSLVVLENVDDVNQVINVYPSK
ncbi:pur operon repressor [Vallitalea okinawensis]|uniref:pur operon repressor n=1 Tax=Vallitalea okinawensis TaxID=2078660 RepID=UPI000CFDFD7F|nr:pur operon repressor [Vallitalea okinawensis]